MSDIHGRADLLTQMLKVIDADLLAAPPDAALHLFLGDYIDRGPSSRQVIDLLIERSHRHDCIFLKGNHEALLLDVLKEPLILQQWCRYGGLQTLMSYGLWPSLNPTQNECIQLVSDLTNALPADHYQFLRNLQNSASIGDFFFVHAGIRPGVDLRNQSEDDLLWIRDEFLLSEDTFEKFIVHGHTPVETAEFCSNRVNIDTGAYATGNLTLLVIQGNQMLAY